MTWDKILQLSGTELAEAVARAKGWRLLRGAEAAEKDTHSDAPTDRQLLWVDEHGDVRVCCNCNDLPDWPGDWQHAGALLEEMELAGVEVMFYGDGRRIRMQAGRGVPLTFGGGTPTERIAKAYCLWRNWRQERAGVAG